MSPYSFEVRFVPSEKNIADYPSRAMVQFTQLVQKRHRVYSHQEIVSSLSSEEARKRVMSTLSASQKRTFKSFLKRFEIRKGKLYIRIKSKIIRIYIDIFFVMYIVRYHYDNVVNDDTQADYIVDTID